MIRQTAELPARTWMAQPAFGDLIAGTLFWGDHGTPVIALLVIVLVTVRRVVGQESTAWPAIAFPLTAAGLVLAGTFVVSHLTPVYLPARTPIFVLPAVALAAGVVIAELAPGLVTAAVALMIATSAVRYSVRSWRQADPFPTRASLAEVVSRARCGDAIVAAGLSCAPRRLLRRVAYRRASPSWRFGPRASTPAVDLSKRLGGTSGTRRDGRRAVAGHRNHLGIHSTRGVGEAGGRNAGAGLDGTAASTRNASPQRFVL